MNFKQVTDALLESVTLQDVATELGVSLQTVRQARMAEASAGHRAPPEGWEAAVRRLAKRQAERLAGLAAKVKKS